MKPRRWVFMVVAWVFGLGLTTYLNGHELCSDLWARYVKGAGDAESKPDTNHSSKQNPNKMLFISCGGFLE